MANFLRNTVNCPNCSMPQYTLTTKHMKLYGSPFRTCSECHAEYYDPHYIEPAFTDMEKAEQKDARNALLYGIAIMAAGAGVIIAGISFLVSEGLEFRYGVSILIGLSMIYLGFVQRNAPYESRAARKEAYAKEAAESAERVKNPIYLMRLREAGVEVPEEIEKAAKRY